MIFPAVNLNATDAMEQIGTLDDGQSVGIQGIVGGTFEICQKVRLQGIYIVRPSQLFIHEESDFKNHISITFIFDYWIEIFECCISF